MGITYEIEREVGGAWVVIDREPDSDVAAKKAAREIAGRYGCDARAVKVKREIIAEEGA